MAFEMSWCAVEKRARILTTTPIPVTLRMLGRKPMTIVVLFLVIVLACGSYLAFDAVRSHERRNQGVNRSFGRGVVSKSGGYQGRSTNYGDGGTYPGYVGFDSNGGPSDCGSGGSSDGGGGGDGGGSCG